jgi:hypothetical protein
MLEDDGEPTLTPLEDAFIRWYLVCGSADVALKSLIHPAHYFDTDKYTAKSIKSRPHVRDTIRKIKKSTPHLRLYAANYVVSLLHDEVQYLRMRTRVYRYDVVNGPRICNGKKSIHEEEATDIELLLRCLELIKGINPETAEHAAPQTAPGNENISVDGLIAQAHELIERAKENAGGQPRHHP